ncbi:MAG: peptidoglycan editing factor PgeF [Chloroflexi bacterium]|nr:peptidoglycan editing factor PgeF [Chloroflexota bacterium]
MLTAFSEGVVAFQFDHLASFPGLRCAVFTRLGGVSAAPQHWLNLSFRADRDSAAVQENRRRAAAALGLAVEQIVIAQQVHGTTVTRVHRSDAGRGALDPATALPASDALITDAVGPALALLVADCAPVVLWDPVRQALGIAHAGWRGAVARVAQRTVEAMAVQIGSRPGDLRAGIGPCIGPCCYEVDEPVLAPLRASFPEWPALVRPGPRGTHLDIPATVRRQLRDAGLNESNIQDSGLCTACRTDLFYSHRAEEGRTGRFGLITSIVG